MSTVQDLGEAVLRWLGSGAMDRMPLNDRLALHQVLRDYGVQFPDDPAPTTNLDALRDQSGFDWLAQETYQTQQGKGLCASCNHWHVGYCRTCQKNGGWCNPL